MSYTPIKHIKTYYMDMSPLVAIQLEYVFICSATPGGNYIASRRIIE